MSRSHAVIRNVVWNHASKILDFGLLYLVRVMIARTLGPANDSQYALFSNLTTILVLLSALGTDWLVYRFAPGYHVRGERDALASLLRKTYMLRVGASAVCMAGVIFVLQNAGVDSRWSGLVSVSMMVGMFVVGQNLTMLGTAAFTALMNTRVVFAVTVSTRMLLTAAIALLAFGGALTAERAITALACAVAVSALLYLLRLWPFMRGGRTPLPVRAMAVFSGVLLSHDLISLVLGRQSDILILSYWFPGDARISIYDNAFQIGLVVQQAVTVGLGGVLFSTYARFAAEARDKLGQAHQRVLQGIQLAYIPVAATAALLAPGLITAVYGERFLPMAHLVQAFLVLDVIDLGLLGGGANVALLNTVGREKTVLINRLSWGALNLAVNLYVIPHYGILAAIVVSRGCSLAAAFTEYRIVVRTVGGGYSARSAFTAVGTTALGVGAAMLLPRETLGDCILAAFAVICVVAVTYAIAKPPALGWALNALRSTVRGSSGDTAAPPAP